MLEITKEKEIGMIIDEYKNDTDEALSKSEVCAITQKIFENMCLWEDIMTEEEFQKRQSYSNPPIDEIEKKIKEIIKQALDNTPINNDLKPIITKKIMNPIMTWINENTVF